MYTFFIAAYIEKIKRIRLRDNKAELLNAICHNYTKIIMSKYLIPESDTRFKQYENKYGKLKSFCIANNDEYDGKWNYGLDLYEVDGGFPVIFVYEDGTVKFKTESNPRAFIAYLDRADKAQFLKIA